MLLSSVPCLGRIKMSKVSLPSKELNKETSSSWGAAKSQKHLCVSVSPLQVTLLYAETELFIFRPVPT